jgi:hypothetical protein
VTLLQRHRLPSCRCHCQTGERSQRKRAAVQDWPRQQMDAAPDRSALAVPSTQDQKAPPQSSSRSIHARSAKPLAPWYLQDQRVGHGYMSEWIKGAALAPSRGANVHSGAPTRRGQEKGAGEGRGEGAINALLCTGGSTRLRASFSDWAYRGPYLSRRSFRSRSPRCRCPHGAARLLPVQVLVPAVPDRAWHHLLAFRRRPT